MNNGLGFAPKSRFFSHLLPRLFWYGLTLWLLVLAQTTFFHVYPLFGKVPDLALLAVLSVALFDNEYAGCVCGVYAGFLETALGDAGSGSGSIISVLPLLFFAVAVFCGTVLRRSVGRPFVSYLVYGSFVCVFRVVMTLATLCIRAGLSDFDLRYIVRYTLVGEFFCDLVMLLPMFPLMTFVIRRARRQ